MEAELTWGTTQKGQKMIIFNGNEFTKELAIKTTTHWKCSKWRVHILAKQQLLLMQIVCFQVKMITATM